MDANRGAGRRCGSTVRGRIRVRARSVSPIPAHGPSLLPRAIAVAAGGRAASAFMCVHLRFWFRAGRSRFEPQMNANERKSRCRAAVRLDRARSDPSTGPLRVADPGPRALAATASDRCRRGRPRRICVHVRSFAVLVSGWSFQIRTANERKWTQIAVQGGGAARPCAVGSEYGPAPCRRSRPTGPRCYRERSLSPREAAPHLRSCAFICGSGFGLVVPDSNRK